MDARAEAEKRYPHEVWLVTADDIGWVDSERDAFVAGAVWALRGAGNSIRELQHDPDDSDSWVAGRADALIAVRHLGRQARRGERTEATP